MNYISEGRRAAICLAVLLTLAVCVSPGMHSFAAEHRKWLGPWVSEDGTTVIRFTDREPGQVVDIGFFDPDGSERAVVEARHTIGRARISRDGYLGIQGTVVGSEGGFLSLYGPYGTLQWEVATEPTARHGPMAVALGGRRVAYAVEQGDKNDAAATAEHVVLLGETGSEVARHPIDDPISDAIRYVRFVGTGEALLVAATGSDVLLFDRENLGLRWDIPATVGIVSDLAASRAVAISEDLSRMALVDGVRVRDRKRPMLRLTVFDTNAGTVVRQEVLSVEFLDARGVRYDRDRRAFIVATKDKAYSFASGE